MQGGQLDKEDMSCGEVVLLMTTKESRALSKVIELAVEKKVKGAKPIQKKLDKVLLY